MFWYRYKILHGKQGKGEHLISGIKSFALQRAKYSCYYFGTGGEHVSPTGPVQGVRFIWEDGMRNRMTPCFCTLLRRCLGKVSQKELGA
jgi:hypothetical protein